MAAMAVDGEAILGFSPKSDDSQLMRYLSHHLEFSPFEPYFLPKNSLRHYERYRSFPYDARSFRVRFLQKEVCFAFLRLFL